MEIPLQITLREMGRSEALAARIRSGAGRLERLHPGIAGCRVVVEEAHRHPGREFSVQVEVHILGRETRVSTACRSADVYVAVRDAFEAVRRQFG